MEEQIPGTEELFNLVERGVLTTSDGKLKLDQLKVETFFSNEGELE